ncbi:MAG: hypothetical protein V4489_03280 [Chlamydiota bacterium]
MIKIRMFKINFILLLVCMSSFSAVEYEGMADGVTRKTIKRLAQEKKLSAVGVGGGMLGDIYKMSISFQLFHSVDQMEARQLLVDVINIYLQDINSSKAIRPYLHDYPFMPKNVQINIWVQNPDRSDVAVNQIAYMVAVNGMLEYDLPRDPVTRDQRELLTETYAEAVKILQE